MYFSLGHKKSQDCNNKLRNKVLILYISVIDIMFASKTMIMNKNSRGHDNVSLRTYTL